MLVIWNERARPMRARRGAGRRVMSSPAKRMLPPSGSSMPASWPMSVVLPAPFGPMMASVSPSRTSRSTPSVARSAPKLFVRARTSSIGLAEDAGEAAAEEDDREDEQRAHDDLPVLDPALRLQAEKRLDQLLAEKEGERADHGPGGRRHAAEDHHEHQVARLLPGHQARGDVVGVVAVKRAGEPAHRAGDDERRQAVRVRREADGARARLV